MLFSRPTRQVVHQPAIYLRNPKFIRELIFGSGETKILVQVSYGSENLPPRKLNRSQVRVRIMVSYLVLHRMTTARLLLLCPPFSVVFLLCLELLVLLIDEFKHSFRTCCGSRHAGAPGEGLRCSIEVKSHRVRQNKLLVPINSAPPLPRHV